MFLLIKYFVHIKRKSISTNSANPYFILATFGRVSSVHLQALMLKKLSHNDYNKRISTRDNGHDQEESKLNSNINANSGAYKLTQDQIIKKVHSIRIT